MQRIVESVLHIFQVPAVNHRIDVTVRDRVIIILETINHEASKGEKKLSSGPLKRFFVELSRKALSTRLYM